MMKNNVIDALCLTRRQIEIRLDAFKKAGHDLMKDPDFPAKKSALDALADTYRDKLLNDTSVRVEKTDAHIISKAGGNLATAVNTDAFKAEFERFLNIIRKKVGA